MNVQLEGLGASTCMNLVQQWRVQYCAANGTQYEPSLNQAYLQVSQPIEERKNIKLC